MAKKMEKEDSCCQGNGSIWMWVGYGLMGAGVFWMGKEAGLWEKVTWASAGIFLLGGIIVCLTSTRKCF
jgi:hypothetical protein